MATYVVQVRDFDEDSPVEMWADFKTVDAPARARRSTIIRMAFLDDPPGAAETVRVLDAASAKGYPVKAKQQTSLEIG